MAAIKALIYFGADVKATNDVLPQLCVGERHSESQSESQSERERARETKERGKGRERKSEHAREPAVV